MKRLINKLIASVFLGILIMTFFTSCDKDTMVPTIKDFQIYVNDINGNDSLVTVIPAFKKIKIVVISDSDKASIWYGGYCNILKTKTGTDSLDIWGNPVIGTAGSDCFQHYGLMYAEGRDLIPGEDEGVLSWVDLYNYQYRVDTIGKSKGEIVDSTFTATVIVTNDGFKGPEFEQAIENYSINVRYIIP